MATPAVIGALRANLSLNSAQFRKGVKQATTSLGRLRSRMKSVSKGIALAGAAAATGFGASMRSIMNEADGMAKTARKIGIPIKELSRLKHAAQLSGVSFAGLQTAVARLSKNMNDATRGVGLGKEAFARLGISIHDTRGVLRPVSEVLNEIAARFADMDDGAEKTALAMDMMGRSGADLIPLLNGGADALERMKREADELGIVITPEMAKRAENFNDNLDRTGKVFRGLMLTMADIMAPALEGLSNLLLDLAKAFAGLSRSAKNGIAALTTGLGVLAAASAGWVALKFALAPIAPLFMGLAKGLTGGLLKGLSMLLMALRGLLPLLASLSLPTLAIGTAIAAATVAVVAFWPEIVRLRDAIVSFINSGWEKLGNIASGIGKWFGDTLIAPVVKFVEKLGAAKDALFRFFSWSARAAEKEGPLSMEPGKGSASGDRHTKAYGDRINAAFEDAGKDRLKAAVDGAGHAIGKTLAGLVEGLKDRVQGSLDGVKGLFKAPPVPVRELPDTAPSATASTGSHIGRTAIPKKAVRETEEGITNLGKALEGLQQKTESVFTKMGDALTRFVRNGTLDFRSLVRDILGGLARMIMNDAFKTLSQVLSGGGAGGIMGGFVGVLGGGRLPGRAHGGPISAGQAYMVGEKGPEVVVPSRSARVIPNSQLSPSGTIPNAAGKDQNIHVTSDVRVSVDDEGALKAWVTRTSQRTIGEAVNLYDKTRAGARAVSAVQRYVRSGGDIA